MNLMQQFEMALVNKKVRVEVVFTEKCHKLGELIILESVTINSLSDCPENCLFFIFSYLTTDINNERSQPSRLIRSACQQLTFIESSSSVISNSNLRVCHEIVSVSVQPLLVQRCILGSSS